MKTFDLVDFVYRFRAWAFVTFGPGERTTGITAHIEKELNEIRAEPESLDEWVDVIQLALIGAARCGFSPEEICAGIEAKFQKNQQRNWPDWRTIPHTSPVEHIKGCNNGA